MPAQDEQVPRKPKTWDERFGELRLFIAKHKRLPDRHWPEFEGEASLAWWVKDQRRRMRIGATETRKRGTLTPKQRKLLLSVNVYPDPRQGRPMADQVMETKLRKLVRASP